MFLAERTVSVTVMRRGRALCVGGGGKNSRQGIVSKNDKIRLMMLAKVTSCKALSGLLRSLDLS